MMCWYFSETVSHDDRYFNDCIVIFNCTWNFLLWFKILTSILYDSLMMWSEYHEKLFFLNKLYFNKIFSLNFIICFLWRLKVLHIYFHSALVHFYESSKTLFKCSLCSLRVLPHTTISSWELALPGLSELMEVISLWKTLLAEWIP